MPTSELAVEHVRLSKATQTKKVYYDSIVSMHASEQRCDILLCAVFSCISALQTMHVHPHPPPPTPRGPPTHQSEQAPSVFATCTILCPLAWEHVRVRCQHLLLTVSKLIMLTITLMVTSGRVLSVWSGLFWAPQRSINPTTSPHIHPCNAGN